MANMEEKDLHKVAGGSIKRDVVDGKKVWRVIEPTGDSVKTLGSLEAAKSWAKEHGYSTDIED